jgi:hypothetical protein
MTFGVKHRFLEYNRLPISQVRNTDKPYLRSFTDVREALPISAINLVRLTPQVFADPSQLLVPVSRTSGFVCEGRMPIYDFAVLRQLTVGRQLILGE